MTVETRRNRLGVLAGLIAACLLAGGCDYFVSPQARVERAQTLVREGQHRRALVDIKNALKAEPQNARARLLAAEISLWLGDISTANAELSRVPSEFDPRTRADLQVRVDLAGGQHVAVLQRLDTLPLAEQDKNVYRGKALQAAHDYGGAEAAFREALRLESSSIEAQVGLLETLVAQGAAEAEQLSRRLVEDFPQAALAWYARGALLARRGESAEAMTALRRAKDLAQGQLSVLREVSLLSVLIEIEIANDDLDGARQSHRQLDRLVPGSRAALLLSARLAMAAEDFPAAAAGLRRMVNAAPAFVQARFLLGVTLLAQGHLEQAASELSQVVQQAPEHIEARRLLAQVRMRLQDPDAALRVLVPGLQTTQDSNLSDLLDAVRTRAGNGAGVIALLEDALSKAPDNRVLQLQLATAYVQSGTPAKAVELLRAMDSDDADVRRSVVLLQSLMASQGPAAARAEIERQAAQNPSDVRVLGLATAFYAAVGDYETGRKLLADALPGAEDPAPLLFSRAQLELAANQPAAAREALTRLLASNPDHVVARFALAQLELTRGDRAAGVGHLERLRQSDDTAVEPRLLLARMALGRNDVKQADQLLSEILTAHPKSADVRNSAGLLYLDSGRYDRAIDMFRAATEIDASSPLVWLNLGRAQFAVGQKAPARASLERSLQFQPHWTPAVGALAFLDLDEGNRAAALQRIDQLKRARPQQAAARALEGELHMALRQFREASQAFDAASELEPSAAFATMSFRARSSGNLARPLEPLELWVKRRPTDIASRHLLAHAYVEQMDRSNAAAQYRDILAAQPNDLTALNNLAWLYHELKDNRAVELARRAYRLAPQSAEVQDTLGWILVENGKLQEGLPLLKQAADRPGASPEIEYHYAAALERAGDRSSALTYARRAERAAREFPSRAEAERLARRLEARGGTE